MANPINTEIISFLSSNNLMYVTSRSNISNFMDGVNIAYVPALGVYRGFPSSDDVLFTREVSIIFPFKGFVLYNNFSSIVVEIEQGDFKIIETYGPGLAGRGIKFYSAGLSGTAQYDYVNIDIPEKVKGKFKISATVKFSDYNDMYRKYTRYVTIVDDLSMQFSSTGPYVSKNSDDLIKSNISVSHSSDFRPVEYSLIPFDFVDSNAEKLADTITFSKSISKIENNSGRSNVHFNFQPDTIPSPIYQLESNDISVELNTKTLIKNLPGISYGDAALDKFYLIANPGDWEFWAAYPNENYGGTTGTNYSNIKPLIVIKNNVKFTNSVVIVDIFKNGSYRNEWVPGFTDTSNYWRPFKNSDNKDFFEVVRDKYIVDSDHESPFSSTGVGIETNISFRTIPDDSKPEEYLEAKMRISVSNNDFFDIILDVTNATSKSFKYIGFDHDIILNYSSNFTRTWPGLQNINEITAEYASVKFNDIENNNFNWNVIFRPDGLFNVGPNDLSLGQVLGNTLSTSKVPISTTGAVYIPTNRKSKTLAEIKPDDPFETEDPRNDPRFLASEEDPRWYTISSKTGLIHTGDPDNHWPYINPDLLPYWHMTGSSSRPSQIEPYLIAEKELPGFDTERGVLAIVAEHPYAMHYTTDGSVDAYPDADPLPGFGAANEYKTKFGMLSGIELIRAKSREITRTRFYYDTTNYSREAWVSNVYPLIDWDNTTYEANGSSGFSKSFKNNAEVVLKSAINDRTNIEEDLHFKIPYFYIDSDDISFAISNDDGVAIPGKISLSQNNIKIYPIQKTTFFYLSSDVKNFEIYENVYSFPVVLASSSATSVFTEGSTIKQSITGATAFVIKEIIDTDNLKNRTLLVNKIFGKFNSSGLITEVRNFESPAGSATPSSIPKRLDNGGHTVLKFVNRNINGDVISSDDLFSLRFDRSYPVELKNISGEESWALRTLTDDIFKGGFFNYGIGNSLSAIQIISNKSDLLVLKGDNLRKKIGSCDRFSITLFNPDEISLDFSTNSYKRRKYKLNKLKFAKNGNIVYSPVNVNIENNKETEIIANVRDNRSKFGGISKKIAISGETLFEYTGIVENSVRISAYIMDDREDIENIDPVKTPLSLGGSNLDSILVPLAFKDKKLHLDITTAYPAENVKAQITLVDESTVVISTTAAITSTRFIINIDQSLYDYKRIEISFDPQSGSGLDALGVVEENEDIGGISLEDDVITKTGFKAIGYNYNDDFYALDDFEAIKFTDIEDKYNYRLAFKYLSENFKNSAFVHTNFANFWYASLSTTTMPSTATSLLFLPPYEVDPSGSKQVYENSWSKNGLNNLENFINYKDPLTGPPAYPVDYRFSERFYFDKSIDSFYTKISYINRGVEINNSVIIYKIDLNHLLDLLPSSFILPVKDFTETQRETYNENFRQHVSSNFFFYKPNGEGLGIASQGLIDYANLAGSSFTVDDNIIYPINYNFSATTLPIDNITKGLSSPSLGINIKVAKGTYGTSEESYKGIGPSFVLRDSNGPGGIQGTIYYEGDYFIESSQGAEGFKLKNDQMMHPFLGHSSSGDSIYYGIGVKKLPINYGFSFGIILKYIDSL